jgi:hypothetical protein
MNILIALLVIFGVIMLSTINRLLNLSKQEEQEEQEEGEETP